MAVIELRSDPKTGLSESQEFTKATDGLVQMVFESDKCVSAWIEYTQVAGIAGSTAKATILPSDSPSVHAPFVRAGCTFKVVASVGTNGFFRGDIVES